MLESLFVLVCGCLHCLVERGEDCVSLGLREKRWPHLDVSQALPPGPWVPCAAPKPSCSASAISPQSLLLLLLKIPLLRLIMKVVNSRIPTTDHRLLHKEKA